MKTADVIIMRHGPKEVIVPKPRPGDIIDKVTVGLSEEGKAQIRDIGHKILAPDYSKIMVVTSDFRRTAETAIEALKGAGYQDLGNVFFKQDAGIGMDSQMDTSGGGTLQYGDKGDALNKYVHDLITNFYFRQRDGNPKNLLEMVLYSRAMLENISGRIQTVGNVLKENEKGLILIVSHGGLIEPGTNVLADNMEFHIDGDAGSVEFVDYKGAYEMGQFSKGEAEFTDAGNIGCRFDAKGKQAEYGFEKLLQKLATAEAHTKIYQKKL